MLWYNYNIIINIEFSCTLSALEKYLEMTNYLRQYILYYTAIIRPLQKRKMRLNHSLQKSWAEQKINNRQIAQEIKNVEDNICKSLTDRTAIKELTLSELNSFHQLQGLFLKLTILIHYDLKCQLYADMNALKEFSFRAHIYYIKESHDSTSNQKSMKSILFLNKTLTNAETHYWLTELEVADLIWLVQKICHMLKSAKKLTIVYTDHSVTLDIVCQSSLTLTTSIDKINLWLI